MSIFEKRTCRSRAELAHAIGEVLREIHEFREGQICLEKIENLTRVMGVEGNTVRFEGTNGKNIFELEVPLLVDIGLSTNVIFHPPSEGSKERMIDLLFAKMDETEKEEGESDYTIRIIGSEENGFQVICLKPRILTESLKEDSRYSEDNFFHEWLQVQSAVEAVIAAIEQKEDEENEKKNRIDFAPITRIGRCKTDDDLEILTEGSVGDKKFELPHPLGFRMRAMVGKTGEPPNEEYRARFIYDRAVSAGGVTRIEQRAVYTVEIFGNQTNGIRFNTTGLTLPVGLSINSAVFEHWDAVERALQAVRNDIEEIERARNQGKPGAPESDPGYDASTDRRFQMQLSDVKRNEIAFDYIAGEMMFPLKTGGEFRLSMPFLQDNWKIKESSFIVRHKEQRRASVSTMEISISDPSGGDHILGLEMFSTKGTDAGESDGYGVYVREKVDEKETVLGDWMQQSTLLEAMKRYRENVNELTQYVDRLEAKERKGGALTAMSYDQLANVNDVDTVTRKRRTCIDRWSKEVVLGLRSGGEVRLEPARIHPGFDLDLSGTLIMNINTPGGDRVIGIRARLAFYDALKEKHILVVEIHENNKFSVKLEDQYPYSSTEEQPLRNIADIEMAINNTLDNLVSVVATTIFRDKFISELKDKQKRLARRAFGDENWRDAPDQVKKVQFFEDYIVMDVVYKRGIGHLRETYTRFNLPRLKPGYSVQVMSSGDREGEMLAWDITRRAERTGNDHITVQVLKGEQGVFTVKYAAKIPLVRDGQTTYPPLGFSQSADSVSDLVAKLEGFLAYLNER